MGVPAAHQEKPDDRRNEDKVVHSSIAEANVTPCPEGRVIKSLRRDVKNSSKPSGFVKRISRDLAASHEVSHQTRFARPRSLLKKFVYGSSRGNEARIFRKRDWNSEPRYLGCYFINGLLAMLQLRMKNGEWQ